MQASPHPLGGWNDANDDEQQQQHIKANDTRTFSDLRLHLCILRCSGSCSARGIVNFGPAFGGPLSIWSFRGDRRRDGVSFFSFPFYFGRQQEGLGNWWDFSDLLRLPPGDLITLHSLRHYIRPDHPIGDGSLGSESE